MTGPILFTARMILRPLSDEDFEPWCAFHSDEVTMRHLGGVRDRSTAWRGLCTMAGAWQVVSGFSMFSCVERTPAAESDASARGGPRVARQRSRLRRRARLARQGLPPFDR